MPVTQAVAHWKTMQRFLAAIDNTTIRNGVAFLVILVFSLLLVRFLTPFGSATTPDSLNYLDMARNYKSGIGVLATDRSLDNHDGMLYREEKLWPPLYPLTLAASAFKLPDVVTASHLSSVLLALTALIAYLLLAPVMKWYFALSAAMLLCLTVPLITVYTYAWSETLFIPLLLLAVWGLAGCGLTTLSGQVCRHSSLLPRTLSMIWSNSAKSVFAKSANWPAAFRNATSCSMPYANCMGVLSTNASR